MALLVLVCVVVLSVACYGLSRKGNARTTAVQAVLALTLCVFTIACPILMELTKLRNHATVPFHTPTMVFYTESLKLVVATAIYGVQWPTLEYTGLDSLQLHSVVAYALPALLYALQNNVNYVALTLIDPPTYQLWGCSKLVFAGGFFRVLLGRQLTSRKWLGLLVLACGMAVTTIRPAAADTVSATAAQGIVLVLGTSALSGLSSVFNEWLIKFQDPKAPLMLKNGLLYGFGALMTAVSCQPHAAIGDPLMFWVLVLVQAITGLTVSLVLKYCDSLVKGFSTSGGVLLAMLVSAAAFGFELRGMFAAGFGLVCVAFYLYFGG